MATTNRVFFTRSSMVCSLALAGLMVAVCPWGVAAQSTSPSAQSYPAAQDRAQSMGISGASNGLVDTGDLPLNAGDVITVQVFATPELSGSLRVDPTGAITLPIGGKLQVSGMTSSEVAVLIEDRLKTAQIMLDPHVTVIVTQYSTQGITITGEVKSPGSYPLVGAHSLADALAVAGGLSTAAGDTITLTHRSDPAHPVTIPINSPNFDQLTRETPVYSRDNLTVSKASVIYLLGDVGRVGPLPVVRGEPPTVLNVLSQTGGVTTTARLSKALIIRKTPSGTTTIPLDLAQIMKNRAPNILLQSADILIVPHSVLKAIVIPLPQQLSSGLVGIATASLYVR